MNTNTCLIAVLLSTVLIACAFGAEPGSGTLKTETFDRDPGWDGVNNRSAQKGPGRTIRQDFGFSSTSHAGGKPGEVCDPLLGFRREASLRVPGLGMRRKPRIEEEPRGDGARMF